MEVVSASGEAYNSSSAWVKVDFDMSSVGRPTIESYVFDDVRSSPTRLGQDFRSGSIV